MPYNLSIPGWMPESELIIIEQLASTIPPQGEMVEVGSFCGRSSWCWARSVPEDVKVYCIDIWDPAAHPFTPPARIGAESEPPASDFGHVADIRLASGSLQNFLNYTSDCPNIVPMRGASPGDFADWPQESLDLIFLDGVHHNPGFREDLNFWYWRLKPGGTLCGHDCARTHPDVLWTVHDFCKDLQLRFLVQERIWILQRPPVRPLSSLL